MDFPSSAPPDSELHDLRTRLVEVETEFQSVSELIRDLRSRLSPESLDAALAAAGLPRMEVLVAEILERADEEERALRGETAGSPGEILPAEVEATPLEAITPAAVGDPLEDPDDPDLAPDASLDFVSGDTEVLPRPARAEPAALEALEDELDLALSSLDPVEDKPLGADDPIADLETTRESEFDGLSFDPRTGPGHPSGEEVSIDWSETSRPITGDTELLASKEAVSSQELVELEDRLDRQLLLDAETLANAKALDEEALDEEALDDALEEETVASLGATRDDELAVVPEVLDDEALNDETPDDETPDEEATASLDATRDDELAVVPEALDDEFLDEEAAASLDATHETEHDATRDDELAVVPEALDDESLDEQTAEPLDALRDDELAVVPEALDDEETSEPLDALCDDEHESLAPDPTAGTDHERTPAPLDDALVTAVHPEALDDELLAIESAPDADAPANATTAIAGELDDVTSDPVPEALDDDADLAREPAPEPSIATARASDLVEDDPPVADDPELDLASEALDGSFPSDDLPVDRVESVSDRAETPPGETGATSESPWELDAIRTLAKEGVVSSSIVRAAEVASERGDLDAPIDPGSAEAPPIEATSTGAVTSSVDAQLSELLSLLRASLASKSVEPAPSIQLPRELTAELAREVAGRVRDAIIADGLAIRRDPDGESKESEGSGPRKKAEEPLIPLDDIASLIDRLSRG